jgi:hypothetical protein
MKVIARGVVENDFHGCTGSSIYLLSGGHAWQQNQYRYEYHYAYRPPARVTEDGGRYLLHVEGMSSPISVTRVSLVEDGPIVSDFRGFSGDAVFEFQSGRSYTPAEYKYNYHYAYRPHAVVVDGVNGLELAVDGMTDTLRVRRA